MDSTIAELSAAIAARSLSPVELVDAHIERVEQVNPVLNALVVERFDAARAEAKDAERLAMKGGELPPLLGIPCSIKEFVGVKGMPNTIGMGRRRGVRAAEDATAVTRLREAGAIILGLGNVPDGGIWMETYNPIYGWTSNPWNTARTPGGSSGGEAALVASGATVFGLAADIGGSIRIPSAMCGTVGHKPTGGTIPNTGCHAPSGVETGRYHSLGPIGRSVDDVALLTRILSGPDGRCPSAIDYILADHDAVRIEDLDVWVLEDNGRARVTDPVRDGVRRAAGALEAAGATVRPLEVPGLKHGFEIWAAMLAHGNDESYAEVLACGEPFSYARELGKVALRRGDYTGATLVISLLSDLLYKLPGDEHWVAQGRKLQASLEDTLGDRGVLLMPTVPCPAPVHRGLLLKPFAHTFVCPFNVLEFPATVVPSGFDDRGLPVSVQLVGARRRDHLAQAAARVVGAATGAWQRTDPRPSTRRRELMHRFLG